MNFFNALKPLSKQKPDAHGGRSLHDAIKGIKHTGNDKEREVSFIKKYFPKPNIKTKQEKEQNLVQPKLSKAEVEHLSSSPALNVSAKTTLTLREFNSQCLKTVHHLNPERIKQIRLKTGASQSVLAAILNTSVSIVQKWETGEKKPSALALKILHLIDEKGLDILI